MESSLTGLRAASTAAPAVWVALLSAACASAPSANEGLDAVLWAQTSAEYRSLAMEAYATATVRLEAALADAGWTAAVEQPPGYDTLPPAIILDIDETVLDNFPYQARLVLRGGRYDRESWAAWVREGSAEAVPGSLAFTRAAAGRGVAVFYVSNRSHELEEATLANLERAGFPVSGDGDRILLRGERPTWVSDKTSRRLDVASRYRVLLVVGDDLLDFVSAEALSPGARVQLSDRYRDWWGTRWIMLPNPAYGSWERAVYGYEDSLDDAERLRRKREGLDPGT